MSRKAKSASVTLGIIIALGFPAVAWAYWDWRAGLLVFLLGQFIIGFAQLATGLKGDRK